MSQAELEGEITPNPNGQSEGTESLDENEVGLTYEKMTEQEVADQTRLFYEFTHSTQLTSVNAPSTDSQDQK